MVNVWCGMMNMVTKIICYNNELCGDDDDDGGGNATMCYSLAAAASCKVRGVSGIRPKSYFIFVGIFSLSLSLYLQNTYFFCICVCI